MAIFNFNYDKEGKGIEKDAPEKNILFTYFESFIRNFWNLMKINILYVAASIPMLAFFAFLFVGLIYPNMQDVFSAVIAGTVAENATQTESLYLGAFMTTFASMMLLVIGSGPASAAFSYATKCMTNEEHVWIWSDFKKQFKENLKQTSIIVLIDIVVVASVIFALLFYSAAFTATGNMIYFVFRTIMFMVSIMYCLMHEYIYQFVVTFDSKLSTAYKNAFIMAAAKLPQNVLLLLIQIVPTYFLFNMLTPFAAAFLLLIVWYALLRYPTEFYAARAIKKVIRERN